jgi:hypothetical protein
MSDNGWRPIETVPEGEHVLLWFPHGECGNGGIEAGTVFREPPSGKLDTGAWTHGGPNAGTDWEFCEPPTMWQPTPAPPTSTPVLSEPTRSREAIAPSASAMEEAAAAIWYGNPINLALINTNTVRVARLIERREAAATKAAHAATLVMIRDAVEKIGPVGSVEHDSEGPPNRIGGAEAITVGIQKIEAAARAKAIEECARIADCGCLVPPDGGSPTEGERLMCEDITRRIRALAAPADDGRRG